MTTTTLSLHRRTRVERRVLAILRGDAAVPLSPDHAACFADLRSVAQEQGLPMAPLATPYLSEGELVLLALMADAQRVVPMRSAGEDVRLAACIRRCADILIDLRLRLSALTLYSGKLHNPPGSRQ